MIELWGLADIARALDVSIQAVDDRHKRGTLPPADFRMVTGRGELWIEQTLVEAGIIPPQRKRQKQKQKQKSR